MADPAPADRDVGKDRRRWIVVVEQVVMHKSRLRETPNIGTLGQSGRGPKRVNWIHAHPERMTRK